MTSSVMAIKGNHLDKLAGIFEVFGYADLERDKNFGNPEEALDYLFGKYAEFTEGDIFIRGVAYHGDWTLICDPEMIDLMEEDLIAELSGKHGLEILVFLIQSASGTFEFAKYKDGKTQRFFSVAEGDISIKKGKSLKEEEGLSINGDIAAEDMLQLAKRYGIDLFFNEVGDMVVKEYGYN